MKKIMAFGTKMMVWDTIANTVELHNVIDVTKQLKEWKSCGIEQTKSAEGIEQKLEAAWVNGGCVTW